MAGKRSRFEEYKSRHGTLPNQNDQCDIEAVLDRLHERIHQAMEELDLSPSREKSWRRVTEKAANLLDHLPKENNELLVTVYVLLSSLDKESNQAR